MKEYVTKETEEVTDPLVGTQEQTESVYEAEHVPHGEVALEHPPMGWPRHARWMAGLLAIFLGSLGVHRFYLGFRSIGLFQLTMTLAIISAVVIGATLGASSQPGAAVLVGSGVLMLTVVWGVVEGLFIFFHVLNSDAQGHPLA